MTKVSSSPEQKENKMSEEMHPRNRRKQLEKIGKTLPEKDGLAGHEEPARTDAIDTEDLQGDNKKETKKKSKKASSEKEEEGVE